MLPYRYYIRLDTLILELVTHCDHETFITSEVPIILWTSHTNEGVRLCTHVSTLSMAVALT